MIKRLGILTISIHRKLITKKTKAIIPVHLYGNPANLFDLKKISLKYKIELVEDAAPALGSLYNEKMRYSRALFRI